MKIVIIVASVISIVSCVTHKTSKNSLIRPWSDQLQKEEPFRYPFVATYSRDNTPLKFVASKHSSSLVSPTFKTINHVISEFRPDLIILEPFEFILGANSEIFTKYANKCSKTKFIKCSEAEYAIHLSRPLNSTFIGGEPTDREILNEVIAQGYQPEDLLGFYLVRQIPQWKRQGRLNKNNINKQIDFYLRRNSKKLKIKTSFKYQEFITWYQTHAGKAFDSADVKSSDTAPKISNAMTYFTAVRFGA